MYLYIHPIFRTNLMISLYLLKPFGIQINNDLTKFLNPLKVCSYKLITTAPYDGRTNDVA